MSRGIFITGTDTGVGKTVVTAGIVWWLRKQGIDVVPMKPVQTGCRRDGDRLIAPDLEFCLSVSGIHACPDEMPWMLPYAYEPACSPHLAGRLAKRYPEISTIKNCADKLLEKHQVVAVEGAGGIMVPLNERQTMLDLMKTLAFPVVLVARTGLGTINHTLLSIQALRIAGVDLLGVVFNRIAPPQTENQFIEEDNPRAVAQFGDVRVLGKLRYLDLNSKAEDAWKHFEEDMTGLNLIHNEVELDGLQQPA
ncbi:MAG: dethiobiotin synthase [Chloroflexi bacterium]|nr:dethiobiotin synthase [Chloroflexota bacterium]